MGTKIFWIVVAIVAAALVTAGYFAWQNGILFPANLEGKSLLQPEFSLKPGHKLYAQMDASVVPQGELYDYEISTSQMKPVRNAEELSKIVVRINSEEEALALARFFTNYETRFLLRSNPFLGIEAGDAIGEIPAELKTSLSEPRILEVNDEWTVERDLLLYPSDNAPARLVRSLEKITEAGEYEFGIKKVITEGEGGKSLLPYHQ